MNLQNPQIVFKRFKIIQKLTGVFVRKLFLCFFMTSFLSCDVIIFFLFWIISQLVSTLFPQRRFFVVFIGFESFCVVNFSICQSMSRKIWARLRDNLPMTLLATSLSFYLITFGLRVPSSFTYRSI